MKKKAKCEPELISGRELARRLGVSETAVRSAVKSGRIRETMTDAKGRRWFNETDARAQWGRNTLPEKPTGRQVVEDINPVIPSATTDLPHLSGLSANEARVARETAQARILTFKAKVMEQELVGVEDVARMWERQVEKAKRLFLALPVELRMLLPSMTSDEMSLVENRIVAILDALASWDPRKGTV